MTGRLNISFVTSMCAYVAIVPTYPASLVAAADALPLVAFEFFVFPSLLRDDVAQPVQH